MARANFGGAADYSQYFLQLYNDYAQRLEAGALEAARNADQEQAALDEDAFNRWEAGEMTDAEWIAYVRERLNATKADAEQQTYWKDVMRDSQERVASDRIEQGVRDLQNRIDEGKSTYQDLRNFLVRERARLQDGSNLHDQLGESIDQINDTIRDNAANGEIARAGYLFQSGQIGGSAAAAMVRKAAERYRVSDPAKYWNLLSQSYDMQTYGSSSGGGGGGGGPSLSNAIDQLEYEADAIDLLNQQFNNGQTIGSLPDGSEVVLGDGTGSPAPVWEEIDQMMVETLQAQYEAKAENGDRDAVEVLQRLETYVENTVQPRNTIPQERQFGILTNSLQQAVDLARVDPDAGARAIGSAIGALGRWANRLNTTTKTEFKEGVSEGTAENPELAAAARRTSTVESDKLDQVTGDFATDAQAFAAAAAAAFGGKNLTPEQASALIGQAGGLLTEGATSSILGGVYEASTKAAGLADGSWTRVQLPNGTMAVVPMVDTAVPGPDGQAVTERRPDLGALNLDPERQDAAMVLRRVNGRTQLVWGVGDYRVNADGERVLALTDGQGGVALRKEDGSWSDSNGRSVALPFFGIEPVAAQRWVNSNPDVAAAALQAGGVDPNSVDLANLYAPTQQIETFDRFREQERQTGTVRPARGNTPQGQFSPQNMGGTMIPAPVKEIGQQLGINFAVQARHQVGPKPGDVLGARVSPTMPNLGQFNPSNMGGTPPSIKPVRLNFNPDELRRRLSFTVGKGVQAGIDSYAGRAPVLN